MKTTIVLTLSALLAACSGGSPGAKLPMPDGKFSQLNPQRRALATTNALAAPETGGPMVTPTRTIP